MGRNNVVAAFSMDPEREAEFLEVFNEASKKAARKLMARYPQVSIDPEDLIQEMYADVLPLFNDFDFENRPYRGMLYQALWNRGWNILRNLMGDYRRQTENIGIQELPTEETPDPMAKLPSSFSAPDEEYQKRFQFDSILGIVDAAPYSIQPDGDVVELPSQLKEQLKSVLSWMWNEAERFSGAGGKYLHGFSDYVRGLGIESPAGEKPSEYTLDLLRGIPNLWDALSEATAA